MTLLKRLQSSEFQNPKIPKMILGLAITIAIFFLALKAPNDPDLFWHLKTGELIWNYKTIPQIDWYSYTMSDFRWIDHEWLTEVIMFKIKETFGWLGLAMFFASITAFVFAWLVPRISRSVKGAKAPFYVSMLMALLGTVVASLTFGIRPQMISVLGIALLLFILRQNQINESAGRRSKLIYALPIIFLFWANMHPGFIIGFAILVIYIAVNKKLAEQAEKNPKAEWVSAEKPLSISGCKSMAYLTFFSFAATFINPYGARLYGEILRAFTDNYAINFIEEWLPPNFHAAEGTIFGFFIIFILIIIFLTKKVDVMSFVLIPLFLFLSLRAARHIPLFALISLPLLIKNMEDFEKTLARLFQKKAMAAVLSVILIFYAPIIIRSNNVFKMLLSDAELAKFGDYPEKAIDFLYNSPNIDKMNIFNEYNWGGYLIYNAKCQMTNDKKKQLQCEPKVFISGIMTFWKTPEKNIVQDYASVVLLNSEWENILEKYRVNTILIKKDNPLSQALKLNNKWDKVYFDEIAVIYKKN